MSKITPTAPSFESRLIHQSREYEDRNGNVFYEHNSRLEPGETVVLAGSDAEMTVMTSPYRNPLTLKEFVKVASHGKGSDEWIEVPLSSVRRLNLA